MNESSHRFAMMFSFNALYFNAMCNKGRGQLKKSIFLGKSPKLWVGGLRCLGLFPKKIDFFN